MGTMAEMKKDVLAVVCSIPKGRVVTYGAIGRFLTISPRHVAFILAGLSRTEARAVPWHRVVSAGGWLNRDRKAGDRAQERRLQREGVVIENQRLRLQEYEIGVPSLPSGLRGGRVYKSDIEPN